MSIKKKNVQSSVDMALITARLWLAQSQEREATIEPYEEMVVVCALMDITVQ